MLLLAVALGAGGAGYLLGRFDADEPAPPRGGAGTTVIVAGLPPAADAPDEAWLDAADPDDGVAETGTDSTAARPPTPPSEIIDSLRRYSDGPRAQKIVAGLIADAARLGAPMLPEIADLLKSGIDVELGGYSPEKGGYPSLRVALLAAAEATGDPAAAAIVAEVTRTSTSPVEVVFGADILDRLHALDAPSAQRTLEALAGPLSAEQRKAMGPVLGRVVPRAAAADPVYAETLLTTQLRASDQSNTRVLMPVLNGLPADRAQAMVLATMTAPDVSDVNKRWIAGQAARRSEVSMLKELRHAIESNTVSPRVATSVAYSSMNGGPYRTFTHHARRAMRDGDLATAKDLATQYYARLEEAQRTVEAARNAGATLQPRLATTARGLQQGLDELRRQIARRQKQLEKQAAK
jgi:hypothetical protein